MDQALVGPNLEPESLQYETVNKKESNPPHSQFIDNFSFPHMVLLRTSSQQYQAIPVANN